MKKKIVSFVLVGILSLTLVACGGNKNEGNEEAENAFDQEEVQEEQEFGDEALAGATTEIAEITKEPVTKESLTKKFEDVNAKYDKMFEMMKGYKDNPETYTIAVFSEFAGAMSDAGEVTREIQEDSLKYGEEKFEQDFGSKMNELTGRQIKFMETYEDLPEMQE